MRGQLMEGVFPVGRFHQFMIHDPKQRTIQTRAVPCW
jgi:hypothetical protein